MEEVLETIILQNKKNSEETNSLLEALVHQGGKNNIDDILETIISQNEKMVKQMKATQKSITDKPDISMEKTNKLLNDLLEESKKDTKINVTLDVV